MIILTDIEGTTSSISFVKETLFPYARERMVSFLEEFHNHPDVAPHIALIRAELGNASMSPGAVGKALQQWIDEDRKHTALKTLQGLIWRDGYAHAAYKAHVYPDAYQYLYRWYTNGIPLWVYSSGSIAAQKLFFSFSDFGDMSWLFNGYFDTTSGGKKETASYHTICQTIGVDPSDILFLSDVSEELDAALQAGLQTCQLLRPNDNPAPAHNHRQAHTFAEVAELFLPSR